MEQKERQKEVRKETLQKVLKRIQRYWFFLLLSMAAAVVTVVSTLYVPILIGRGVDYILGAGQVDFPSILGILAEIGIVVGITAFFQWLMNVSNNKIAYHVVHDIREEAFRRIEILPLRYIDSHSYGEIVSRVIADVDIFADGLLMGFTQLFTGVITILGTLIIMLTVNGWITAVVVCITPLSLFVASFIAKKTFTMFGEQSSVRGEQTAFIDEMIGNQQVVQAFGREAEVEEQFAKMNHRLENCSLKAIFYSSITNPATRFVNSMVYAGVGITGALAAIGGGISVGQLTCMLSYANQYTKPFNEISGVVTELQNALACAGRIFALIEEEPQKADKPDALARFEAKGEISLQNVCFSYLPGQKLIEDFNLEVKPGQRIAIVGPTGCGKTTVINLLMRFYDVDRGTICVDGCDVTDMTRHALRENYGMVLQETWLKTGTIRENLLMGKETATEEEMMEAAKAAHAHSFIMRLPKGYDTFITEDGGSLSQGQKQLLCITRVMLVKPPILILDEATSSIDTRTEQKIQKAFERLMEGRTSFIVAHRLSTIQGADKILVMKDGNIVEQGSHQQLLAKHGFYANLYNSQWAQ
ncbi:MAG: ABC transporter ATP-binding protein [Hespellia sp.]|nr:ABC transporter ATP-binding protein [Hespellia sp.]